MSERYTNLGKYVLAIRKLRDALHVFHDIGGAHPILVPSQMFKNDILPFALESPAFRQISDAPRGNILLKFFKVFPSKKTSLVNLDMPAFLQSLNPGVIRLFVRLHVFSSGRAHILLA